MRWSLAASVSALLVLSTSAAEAQRAPADSIAQDSLVRLPAVEAAVSIVGAIAGPRTHSGVPARVSGIDRIQLTSWRPDFVGDAILGEPSASLYDDLGSPFKQTLVMRGFAASPVVGLPQGVTVLLDGIPMNEPGAGEVSFDLLPLEFIDHIEVLSGTASLLGPNSLGGAINLRTPHAPSGGHVEVSAGSWGAREVSAAAGSTVGAMSYHAGVLHQRVDGFREEMRGRRTLFMLSGALPASDRGLRAFMVGAHSRAETAGSLPLSVYEVRPDSNLTGGDFELLRQLMLGVSGYATAGEGIITARAYGRIGDAERFNVNQEADPDVRGFTESRTAGIDTDWTRALEVGSFPIDVRIGAGGLINHTAIDLHAERIDPGQTTAVSSTIARFDAYALAAAHIGSTTITAAARWDALRVPFNNRLRPDRDTMSTFTHLSPRIGATTRLGASVSAYASIGRSFRPPALIEIACADPEEPCPLPFALGDDPPIDPVRVTTVEAGLEWNRAPLRLRTAVYRSEVYDDIFLFPYEDESEPEGSTIDGYFDNVEHTRREGIETSADFVTRAGHRAFASWGWTLATFRTEGVEIFSIREAAGAENEVGVGSRFPLVPEHTGTAGVDVVPIEPLSLGARVHYTGERYLRGDEANDEAPLPSCTTFDVRAGIALRGWMLDAVLRNAANEPCLAFGTFNINQGGGGGVERFVTPAAPRGIEVALRRTF